MSRGIDGAPIFRNDADRTVFIDILRKSISAKICPPLMFLMIINGAAIPCSWADSKNQYRPIA
jgi:hypothetical protein